MVRVLIAEDDPVSRHILDVTLRKWDTKSWSAPMELKHGRCFEVKTRRR